MAEKKQQHPQKRKRAPAKSKAPAKDTPGVLDVVCGQCRGVYYETTKHYDPERVPNTSMCRLKEPYRSRGWDDWYSPPPGDGAGNMECPQCGAPYVQTDLTLQTRGA